MTANGGCVKVMMSLKFGSGELTIYMHSYFNHNNRTNPIVRTILPAMQYLNQSLVTILKELKSVTYRLGPVAECVGCKKQKSLEYITYDLNYQSTIANNLRCSKCAYLQPISITTAGIKSKVISVVS